MKRRTKERRKVLSVCECVCVITRLAETHLKHFIDALAALRRCFKVMKAPGLRPQTPLPLVYHTPLRQVDL